LGPIEPTRAALPQLFDFNKSPSDYQKNSEKNNGKTPVENSLV
jgi:hypothetical protein